MVGGYIHLRYIYIPRCIYNIVTRPMEKRSAGRNIAPIAKDVKERTSFGGTFGTPPATVTAAVRG